MAHHFYFFPKPYQLSKVVLKYKYSSMGEKRNFKEGASIVSIPWTEG